MFTGVLGDCVPRHRSRCEEFRQSSLLSGLVSVCRYVYTAGPSRNLRRCCGWYHFLPASTMGADFESKGVERGDRAALLFVGRGNGPNHNVLLVQSI